MQSDIRVKYKEAQYFLGKMQEESSNPEHFRYELSAFLTAARSVLQYIHKGVKGARAQAWYDRQCNLSSSIKYFRCKRNVNVHTKPVSPDRVNVDLPDESVRVSDVLMVTLLDQDGNVIETHRTRGQEEPSEPVPPSEAPEFTYYFEDWPGEDVVTACGFYLQDIGGLLIKDGEENGYI